MLNAKDLAKMYRCALVTIDQRIASGYLRREVRRGAQGQRVWHRVPSRKTLEKRIARGRLKKQSAGMRKMWAEGRGRRNDGANNSNSKLTEADVRWIWLNQRRITTGEMLRTVGLIDHKVVSRIITGENWGPLTSKLESLPAHELKPIGGEEIRLIPRRPSFGISPSGKIYFFKTAADDKSLIFSNPIPKLTLNRKLPNTPAQVRFSSGQIKEQVKISDLIAEAWPEISVAA